MSTPLPSPHDPSAPAPDAEALKAQLHILRQQLSQRRAKLQRTLQKQLLELEETQSHDRYRQIGDSLLANPDYYPRGHSQQELINVHTQELISVQLNPKMDAVENAHRYYKKAHKGKRGLEAAQSKVATTTSELRELELALQSIEQHQHQNSIAPQTLEQLQTLVSTPATQRQSSATAPSAPEHEALPYRVLHYEGWEILVGRNSTQNDELSTRFAKPWDIWLHVAAHAGSHVVIRRPKNGPWPPHSVVETAAAFAVWFSKAKHTSFAEVHVTERRFVTKRRKAPPGEVQIQQYKTLRVAPLSPQQFFKN